MLRATLLLTLAAGCAAPRAPAPAQVLRQAGDPGLRSEVVLGGPLEDRLSSEPADLVVFFGGEEKGSLEACGCPGRPLGGVALQAAYITAAAAAAPDTPMVTVNGGYWLDDARSLDGSPRPDALARNRWMAAGLQQLGADALNVGTNDVGALAMSETPPELPMVSAHVTGPGIAPWRVVEVGGLRVGITGLTAAGGTFHDRPGYTFGHPVLDATAALDALREQVDLVVLLAYAEPAAARAHALAGRVDVVIDTNRHRERYPPIRVGEAIWVRSHMGTERLGELRLTLGEGGVVGAVERKIALDPELAPAPDLAVIEAAARDEVQAAQRAAFGEVIREGGPPTP